MVTSRPKPAVAPATSSGRPSFTCPHNGCHSTCSRTPTLLLHPPPLFDHLSGPSSHKPQSHPTSSETSVPPQLIRNISPSPPHQKYQSQPTSSETSVPNPAHQKHQSQLTSSETVPTHLVRNISPNPAHQKHQSQLTSSETVPAHIIRNISPNRAHQIHQSQPTSSDTSVPTQLIRYISPNPPRPHLRWRENVFIIPHQLNNLSHSCSKDWDRQPRM